MLSFKIYSDELTDRLLVPFYQIQKITDKYTLTVEKVSEQITNGIDIRTYKEEGTPYLRGVDIKRCQVNLLTSKKVEQDFNNVDNKIKLKEGDVLITRKGTVGVTSIVSSDCKNVIIGTEIIKVRLKSDAKITPEYLYTMLNSKIGILQIYSKMTGTVSRGINHPSLKTIKIPTLQQEEMQKIDLWVKEAKQKHTESLNYIEKALHVISDRFNRYKEKEVLYYKINFSTLSDSFTPKYYFPKYVKSIKNIKKDYKTIKLKDFVTKISKGEEIGSEIYKTYLDKSEDDVPFIRTSDLPNYELDDYPDYYADLNVYDNLKQNLEAGDIILTKDGKIGLTAMVTDADKCILSSGLSIIKPNDKESYSTYLFAILSSFIGEYQALQHTVVSSTLPHLNVERLGNIEIPLIEDDEMKKIKENVEKAFKLKAEKKLLIRKAKKLIETAILE